MMLTIGGLGRYEIRLEGDVEASFSCRGNQQIEIQVEGIEGDRNIEGGLLVIMKHGDNGWEVGLRLLEDRCIPWPVEILGGTAKFPESVVVVIKNIDKVNVHVAVGEKN